MNAGKLLRTVGFVALLAIVIPFVIFAVPQVVGASHSYVVLSGSMQPTIAAGDVVIVDSVETDSLQEGDVITFEPPSDHQLAGAERITHRIIEVVEREDGTYFRTKGDANEEPDRALVPADNVVGRVAFAIPKLGYVSQFAGSDQGILLLVIVPAALLIISEVYDLVMAARRSGAESEGGSTGGDASSAEFDWQGEE